jgi:hypothetical protein
VALQVIRLAAAKSPGANSRVRQRGIGLLAVVACAALLAAACGSGSTPSATSQQPDTPQGHLATSAASAPPIPDCPTTPVAGPAHTLNPWPASIDGYQRQDIQNYSELVPYGQAACKDTASFADYANSQLTVLSIDAGHHADLWPSGTSFWSVMWGGAVPVSVPAGPQGGQALCESTQGFACVWYDNDTFGNLTCPDTVTSQSQCLSLMYAFRAAVEQPG